MFWEFWKDKPDEVETRIIEMREAKATVYIEIPPAKVWEHLSDVRNYNQWVRWFKVTDPEQVTRLEKAGDCFDYETTVMGLRFTGRMVAVERIAPQRSMFCLVAFYRGGGEYLLEPLLNGTRVHYTIWGEIPSSYVGKLIDRVLFAGEIKQHMQDHLNRLKAWCEGTPLP